MQVAMINKVGSGHRHCFSKQSGRSGAQRQCKYEISRSSLQ